MPISGTADPLGTVTVSIVGLDPIITPVDEDGNYSVTFFGLERGSYEAIATQTIGGAPAGDATVEFDVGVDGEEGRLRPDGGHRRGRRRHRRHRWCC